MGEIKSAWEIAMEKIGGLEELSPEELKRKKEEKLSLIGQAVTDKYLAGLNLRQMEAEMDKYTGSERQFLNRIVAQKLISAIELKNNEILNKIIEGINFLKNREIPGKVTDEIKQLFLEYEQILRKTKEERSESDDDTLRKLGISGSAVAKVIFSASVESEQVLKNLAGPYNEKLEILKQELYRFTLT